MAGGQGTRLGSSEPKGCYDVGLPSGKSLFQIQIERVRRLVTLSENKTGFPVFFMTSPATHAPTVQYFQDNKFFGLPATDVSFFQQGMLPCLTYDGKILMQSKTQVALAPDGNGGIYKALRVSGALEDMKRRGVKYVHIFGVDNILVKVGDPSFVGYCISRQSSASNKVVLKCRPTEKVGVMCLRNGVPGVVEYSEISKEMSELWDSAANRLVYSAGNIAQHFFTVAFLESVQDKTFPIHVAKKNIPALDSEGKATKVAGIKLECFIFDSFAWSKAMSVFAVPRFGEFSGVKNKTGRASPASAGFALSSYHIQVARQSGAIVNRSPYIHPAAYEGNPEMPTSFTHPGSLPNEAGLVQEPWLEINPLLSYEGEGLPQHFSRIYDNSANFNLPCHLDVA